VSIVGIGIRQDSPKGSDIGQGKGTLHIKYLVETNDYNDGPLVVLNAAGLPYEGNLYRFGNEAADTAIMTKFSSVERLEQSLWWVVECEYTTPDKQKQTDPNPTLELPDVKTSSRTYDVPAWTAVDDDGVITDGIRASNGELFNPPPTCKKRIRIIDMSRNEPENSPVETIAQTYQDATNSDTFFGWPKGMVQCVDISAERKIKTIKDGNTTQWIPYLRVNYKFEARGDGWDLQIPDQGTYYWDDNGDKMSFQAKNATPYVGNLNGSGGILCSDEDTDCTTPAVVLNFQVYPSLPFSSLNLPQDYRDTRNAYLSQG